MRRWLCVALLGASAMLLGRAAYAETIQSTYAEALRRYHAGDNDAAVTGFERILALPLHHPDLYYNLGNAYFRNGELGLAIYNYERALALQPSAEDVRFNLRTARKAAVSKVKDVVKGGNQLSGLARVTSQLSLAGWFTLFAIFWWLLLVGLIVTRFLGAGPWRSGIFALVGLMALGCLASGPLLGLSYQQQLRNRQAIVLRPSIDVREGPRADARKSFAIHAGLSVRVKQSEGEWVRIRLANGLEGWVQRSSVGLL